MPRPHVRRCQASVCAAAVYVLVGDGAGCHVVAGAYSADRLRIIPAVMDGVTSAIGDAALQRAVAVVHLAGRIVAIDIAGGPIGHAVERTLHPAEQRRPALNLSHPDSCGKRRATDGITCRVLTASEGVRAVRGVTADRKLIAGSSTSSH